MPEALRAMQHLALSRTLWLVLLLPALGLVAQGILGGARARLSRPAAIATLALALASIAFHAGVLVRVAPEKILYCHLAPGLRLGPVVSDLDLRLDALSCGASLVACIVALAAGLLVRGRADLAWIHLALGGALVEFLTDDLLLLAMSWSIAVAAAAWMAGKRGADAVATTTMRGGAGLVALVVGIVLVEGRAGELGSPDTGEAAAIGAVVAHSAHGSSPGASLTMTSPAAAAVFVDDARTPAARTPFDDVALSAGTHVFRVSTAASSPDVTAGPVLGAAGDSILLLPVAFTSSLHAIADLRAAGSVRSEGEPPARHDVALVPWSAPLLWIVLVAWLAAAGALSASSFPLLGAPLALGAVACATTAIAGPFLLLRAAQSLPLPQGASALVVLASATTFLAALWRALSGRGPARGLSFAAGTPSSESLFVAVSARLGEHIASMDRWVVGATVDAAASGARAVAWVVAWQDEHVMGMPGNRVARRFVGAARGLEPVFGAPAGRLAWWVLGVVAVLVLARGLWPGVH